jgi:hypothetical protein
MDEVYDIKTLQQLSVKELKAVLSNKEIPFHGDNAVLKNCCSHVAVGCFEKSELIDLLMGKIKNSGDGAGSADSFMTSLLGAGPALTAAYQMKASYCSWRPHPTPMFCEILFPSPSMELIHLGRVHVGGRPEEPSSGAWYPNQRGTRAAGANRSCSQLHPGQDEGGRIQRDVRAFA